MGFMLSSMLVVGGRDVMKVAAERRREGRRKWTVGEVVGTCVYVIMILVLISVLGWAAHNSTEMSPPVF
jgi:hypothetical protein